MFSEFKSFIMRGNVIDLAVGVVIGAAFTKIVTALVEKVIMPIVGILFGSPVDFKDLALKVGSNTIGWGVLLTEIVNFLIVAFVLFLIIKAFNHATKSSGGIMMPREGGVESEKAGG